MEITASEMKKSIEKIYRRLDEVTPVDFDCGKLCGEVCCVYDAEDYRNEELALYLLPGEELMYEAKPSELVAALTEIFKLRAEWYEIPAGEPTNEGGEGEEKNG